MNENKILKLKPSNLFATYKTENELHNYFKKFNGSEGYLVWLGAMLLKNHIVYNYNLIRKEK